MGYFREEWPDATDDEIELAFDELMKTFVTLAAN
jgi:hypothetical protein